MTIPYDVANFPVFIKNPKHGIVGFTDQNLDGQDATALQDWLNSYGYNLDVDGVYGPSTSNALNDLYNRAVNGEVQDITRSSIPKQNTPRCSARGSCIVD